LNRLAGAVVERSESQKKGKIFHLLRKYFSVIALLGIVAVFSFWNDRFLTITNLKIIAQQSAILAIAAYGGMVVIICGSIDLSVGSLVGLCAVSAAAITKNYGPGAGMLAGVIVGFLGGSFNGVVYAKGKIPSFIVTLGILNAGRGLILMITQGRPILVEADILRFLGGGMVLGIPMLLIMAIIFVFITHYILLYIPFGRYVYAIGGGENVAKLSGVEVDKAKIWAFIMAGVYAGIGGVLLAGRMAAGSPTAGDGMVMDVITAIILGGTLLTGGVGNAFGTLIGALIMGSLSNGLNIVGVNPYVQYVVKGLVLIGAVGITLDRKKIGIIK